MQVTNLTFNRIQNKKYSQSTRMTAVDNRNSNLQKSFVDAKDSYGRYIAFKSTAPIEVAQKIARLNSFLLDEVAPFLEKHKELAEQNNLIHQKASAILDAVWKKRNNVDAKIDESFRVETINIVNEHLKKPLLYLQNLKKYESLNDESKKYFVDDEVRQFADIIAPQIHKITPYLDSFNPLVAQYHKTIKDARNGIDGLTNEQVIPRLNAKSAQIREAELRSLFSLTFYDNVSLFQETTSAFLKRSRDKNYDFQGLDERFEKIYKIRQSMLKHEENLPKAKQNVALATQLLDNNTFSEEEVNQVFQLAENKYLQIIDRNVNRFKKYFNEHPEFRWDKAHDAETDALLAEQNKLNEELRQRIDDSEYRFFHRDGDCITAGSHCEEPMGNGDLPF